MLKGVASKYVFVNLLCCQYRGKEKVPVMRWYCFNAHSWLCFFSENDSLNGYVLWFCAYSFVPTDLPYPDAPRAVKIKKSFFHHHLLNDTFLILSVINPHESSHFFQGKNKTNSYHYNISWLLFMSAMQGKTWLTLYSLHITWHSVQTEFSMWFPLCWCVNYTNII